mgnify:FL=1
MTWTTQKLRHYLISYITYLISGSDPLKYLLEKPMPIGHMAKWQMVLLEFDIVFTIQKAINLTENSREDDY